MMLFVSQDQFGDSGDASSPFDRLRVRTTLAALEILMLSLSKHKDFGPSVVRAGVYGAQRQVA
jgi:hypothetical protein